MTKKQSFRDARVTWRHYIVGVRSHGAAKKSNDPLFPRALTCALLVAGSVLPAFIPSALAQDIKTMHGKIMGEAHIQMSSTDQVMMAKMMGQMNASDKEVYAGISMKEKMLLMKMMRTIKT